MSDAEVNEVLESQADAATDEDGASTLTHEQALAELAKVRREAAARRVSERQLKAEREELQRYRDAEKTELEKIAERAQRAEAELATVKREKMALDAAKAAGLGSEWADLVKGDSEEEMADSAQALAERIGSVKPAPPAGVFNSNTGQPVKAPESASEAFRKSLFQNR